jgi:hypothetical protein
LENLGVDRKIFKGIFKKLDVAGEMNGLIKLRIGPGGGLL